MNVLFFDGENIVTREYTSSILYCITVLNPGIRKVGGEIPPLEIASPLTNTTVNRGRQQLRFSK